MLVEKKQSLLPYDFLLTISVSRVAHRVELSNSRVCVSDHKQACCSHKSTNTSWQVSIPQGLDCSKGWNKAFPVEESIRGETDMLESMTFSKTTGNHKLPGLVTMHLYRLTSA